MFDKKSRRKITLIIIGVFIISTGLAFYLGWENVVTTCLQWIGVSGIGYVAGDSYRKSE